MLTIILNDFFLTGFIDGNNGLLKIILGGHTFEICDS